MRVAVKRFLMVMRLLTLFLFTGCETGVVVTDEIDTLIFAETEVGYSVSVAGEVVYLRNDMTGAVITLEGEETGVNFGASLALHKTNYGTLMAVGAPDGDNGNGVVYVFLVVDDDAHLRAKLLSPSLHTMGYGDYLSFVSTEIGWVLSVQSSFGSAAQFEIWQFAEEIE